MSQAGVLSIKTGPSGTDVVSVTGNDSVPVYADASGNINIIGLGGFTFTGNPGTHTLDLNPSGEVANYTNVVAAESPYTVLPTDYYISVDCSGGPVNLVFPSATVLFRLFIIKDRLGDSATNHITFTTTPSTIPFDNENTYTLETNFGATELLFNGTAYEVF